MAISFLIVIFSLILEHGSDFASIVTTDGGDDNILITQLNNNGNTIAKPRFRRYLQRCRWLALTQDLMQLLSSN